MDEKLSILSENFLKEVSYKSSLCVNLANYSMSKFTDEDLYKLLNDVREIRWSIAPILYTANIHFRVKSDDSIKLKIEKYKKINRKAQLCLNDIIGFRIIVDDFPELSSIPKYFHVIDLTKGKEEDDGYRAIHLYYKLDNYHYQIEIQIWKSIAEEFTNWVHKYCYKHADKDILVRLRKLFDIGKIVTEKDFKKELDTALAVKYFRERFGGLDNGNDSYNKKR